MLMKRVIPPGVTMRCLIYIVTGLKIGLETQILTIAELAEVSMCNQRLIRIPSLSHSSKVPSRSAYPDSRIRTVG